MKNLSSDLCLPTCTSPLFKPVTLVGEHEIISDNLLCFQDILWISDFLRISRSLFHLELNKFFSTAKLICFFAFRSSACGFTSRSG